MTKKYLDQEKLILTLNVKELDAQQIRLIKSINSLLTQLLATEDESDYFDNSQDLLKLVASAIKCANFCKSEGINPNIPYANQALEFSFDSLAEQILSDKIVNFDN